MTKTLVWCGFLLVAACTLSSERQAVTIATDATFPPFHFLDDDGEPTGFDVALAEAALARAGLSSNAVVRSYDELFVGLRNGSHQLVAATTGVTAERQRSFGFSTPYFHTCQVAVVRAQDGFEVLEDLRGARVGAEGEGTSFLALGTLPVEGVQLADGSALEKLVVREIDAWIVDEFAGVRIVKQSAGQLDVLPEPVAQEAYAFVFEKSAATLKDKLDAGLSALRRDGGLTALEQQFGLHRDAHWPVRCGEVVP